MVFEVVQMKFLAMHVTNQKYKCLVQFFFLSIYISVLVILVQGKLNEKIFNFAEFFFFQ